jgi:hypothetical protein
MGEAGYNNEDSRRGIAPTRHISSLKAAEVNMFNADAAFLCKFASSAVSNRASRYATAPVFRASS